MKDTCMAHTIPQLLPKTGIISFPVQARECKDYQNNHDKNLGCHGQLFLLSAIVKLRKGLIQDMKDLQVCNGKPAVIKSLVGQAHCKID